MTSKVTIEVNLSTYMPYFRIIHDPKSDDVRDKLIGEFIGKLSPRSLWCQVQYGPDIDHKPVLHIIPLEGMDLEDHAARMEEQAEWHYKDLGGGIYIERKVETEQKEKTAVSILEFINECQVDGTISKAIADALETKLAG